VQGFADAAQARKKQALVKTRCFSERVLMR